MAISEVVAGRTGKQIEAAKRAQTTRLGQSGAAGKRKRCKKGKSCGASCINSGKVCLVDIPWASGSQIAKVAKKVQDRGSKAPKTVEDVKAKLKSHYGKFKEAAIAEDGKEYTFHRKEIAKLLKELKDRGEEVPDVPLPPWSKVSPIIKEAKEAEAKGDNAGKAKAIQKFKDVLLGKKQSEPKGSEPRLNLSPLQTTADFKAKKAATEGFYNDRIKAMHTWVGKILDGPPFAVKNVAQGMVYFKPSSWLKGYFALSGSFIPRPGFSSDAETKFFEKLRASLLKDLGREKFEDTVSAIRLFTGGEYKKIRNAQMNRQGAKADHLRMAKLLEDFIARKEIDKPTVEKFRGKRVDDQTLKAMIESAKENGTYSGRALSSWSTSLQIAQNFADNNPHAINRVIYRTVNVKGAPLGSVSSHSSENEILTPATANYKYVSYHPIVVNYVTYHMFDVVES